MALGLNGGDKLLVTGPLYHVGAFDLPGVAVLWVGGMLCIERDFDPVRALAAIAREKLTGGVARAGHARARSSRTPAASLTMWEACAG